MKSEQRSKSLSNLYQRPSLVYNVVGSVKGHSKFCEPEEESMAVWLSLPDRSSLDH